MKTLVISVVAAVVLTGIVSVVGANYLLNKDKSATATSTAPTNANAGTPNDAAVASAHIIGSLPRNVSASVKAQTTIGGACDLEKAGEINGNVNYATSQGTISITRPGFNGTTNVPAASLPTQTVKVEVVGGGSIPVTGSGSVGVKGSGNVGVLGSGNIPVAGSGAIVLSGSGNVSMGSMTIGDRTVKIETDSCGRACYRGQDGKLYLLQ